MKTSPSAQIPLMPSLSGFGPVKELPVVAKPPNKQKDFQAWMEYYSQKIRAKNIGAAKIVRPSKGRVLKSLSPAKKVSAAPTGRGRKRGRVQVAGEIASQSIPESPFKGKYRLVEVDAADRHFLDENKWRATWNEGSRTFYVIGPRHQSLHRLITNAPEGKVVDHGDENGLNNRRSNLTACDHADNVRRARPRRVPKTSKFTGVQWNERCRKWRAQLKYNYATVYLGLFVDEIAAARAYDQYARALYGQFARCNFQSEVTA